MKIKIGYKLLNIREDRKMSQHEMADFLSMSPSSYARLERNETCIALDELSRISESLNIPIQELLPEIFSIHISHNGHGLIFGNITYNNTYLNSSEYIKELELKLKLYEEKNDSLKN